MSSSSSSSSSLGSPDGSFTKGAGGETSLGDGAGGSSTGFASSRSPPPAQRKTVRTTKLPVHMSEYLLVGKGPTLIDPAPKARDEIINHDFCDSCGDGGDLLCCDECPASFHLKCCDPPLTSVPTGDWSCTACRARADPPYIPPNDSAVTPLIKQMLARNPTTFTLPQDLLDSFEIEPKAGSDSFSVKKRKNDPHCHACKMTEGDRIPCNRCARTFHLYCLEPPLMEAPTGPWECPAHQFRVSQCIPPPPNFKSVTTATTANAALLNARSTVAFAAKLSEAKHVLPQESIRLDFGFDVITQPSSSGKEEGSSSIRKNRRTSRPPLRAPAKAPGNTVLNPKSPLAQDVQSELLASPQERQEATSSINSGGECDLTTLADVSSQQLSQLSPLFVQFLAWQRLMQINQESNPSVVSRFLARPPMSFPPHFRPRPLRPPPPPSYFHRYPPPPPRYRRPMPQPSHYPQPLPRHAPAEAEAPRTKPRVEPQQENDKPVATPMEEDTPPTTSSSIPLSSSASLTTSLPSSPPVSSTSSLESSSEPQPRDVPAKGTGKIAEKDAGKESTPTSLPEKRKPTEPVTPGGDSATPAAKKQRAEASDASPTETSPTSPTKSKPEKKAVSRSPSPPAPALSGRPVRKAKAKRKWSPSPSSSRQPVSPKVKRSKSDPTEETPNSASSPAGATGSPSPTKQSKTDSAENGPSETTKTKTNDVPPLVPLQPIVVGSTSPAKDTTPAPNPAPTPSPAATKPQSTPRTKPSPSLAVSLTTPSPSPTAVKAPAPSNITPSSSHSTPTSSRTSTPTSESRPLPSPSTLASVPSPTSKPTSKASTPSSTRNGSAHSNPDSNPSSPAKTEKSSASKLPPPARKYWLSDSPVLPPYSSKVDSARSKPDSSPSPPAKTEKSSASKSMPPPASEPSNPFHPSSTPVPLVSPSSSKFEKPSVVYVFSRPVAELIHLGEASQPSLKISKSCVTIGRHKAKTDGLDFNLAELGTSKYVSHEHAMIVFDTVTDTFWITNYGRNGTKINDVQVAIGTRAKLTHKAQLEIGKIRFTFKILGNRGSRKEVCSSARTVHA